MGKNIEKLKKNLTPFNRRVIKAREHVKISQTDLASRASCTQGAIEKLENRPTDGSVYTVQIARACGVNPFWLAEGDPFPMISAADLPPDAVALGAAWHYIKGWPKDELAYRVLMTALPFMPATHPLYKTAERLYRESVKRVKIAEDLSQKTA